MTDLPTVTRADWAQRIAARWQTSLTAIFETGRLIAAAKESLEHGEFLEMIRVDLPFGANTAQRLMKVASDPRITNAAHAPHLPAHWATLYEITKLTDEAFAEKIADGTISPDMDRRAITREVKRARRDTREVELAEKQKALPDRKFGVILADPEWRFEPWSRTTGMDRAADNHYPTSVTEVIASRPVEKIAADDCVLFLWATVPMLPQALMVMGAWGFDYRSQVVWVKDREGTGYWFRNKHEVLLVGVRGKPPAPAPGTQIPSAFHEPVLEHSRKPDFVQRFIEQYFPNLPKIELNARRARPGWESWGLEAPDVPHDPETGEIIEDQKGGGQPEPTAHPTAPAVRAADESTAPIADRSALPAEGTAPAEPAADEGSASFASGSPLPPGETSPASAGHATEESPATISESGAAGFSPPAGAAGEAQACAAETRSPASAAPVPNPDLDIPTFLRRTAA